MSIHFLYGKPGGGKSRFAAEKGIIELIKGDRPIFTNLAYLPGRLAEYCKQQGREVNLFERLYQFTDEETREFFSYRPGPVVDGWQTPIRVKMLSKDDWANGLRPDYSHIKDSGVVYIIDEIQIHYNSRDWQQTGRNILHYISQHRKRGDTCFFITQHLDNVDKQLRSVAQDFTYCRNMSKIKVSFWKMPKIFIWETRLSDSENAPVSESGHFHLDTEGIASTYDTSQGVSMAGGTLADMKEKVRGIPWWVGLLVLAILLYVAFFTIPKIILRFIGHQITPRQIQQTTEKALNENYRQGQTQTTNVSTWKQPESSHPVGNTRAREGNVLSNNVRVTCDGYFVTPTEARVFLNNGEVLYGQFVTSATGIYQGTNYYPFSAPQKGNEGMRTLTLDEMYPYGNTPQFPVNEIHTFQNSAGEVLGRRTNLRNAPMDGVTSPSASKISHSPDNVRPTIQ